MGRSQRPFSISATYVHLRARQEWLLDKIYNIVKKADEKEHLPQTAQGTVRTS